MQSHRDNTVNNKQRIDADDLDEYLDTADDQEREFPKRRRSGRNRRRDIENLLEERYLRSQINELIDEDGFY